MSRGTIDVLIKRLDILVLLLSMLGPVECVVELQLALLKLVELIRNLELLDRQVALIVNGEVQIIIHILFELGGRCVYFRQSIVTSQLVSLLVDVGHFQPVSDDLWRLVCLVYFSEDLFLNHSLLNVQHLRIAVVDELFQRVVGTDHILAFCEEHIIVSAENMTTIEDDYILRTKHGSDQLRVTFDLVNLSDPLLVVICDVVVAVLHFINDFELQVHVRPSLKGFQHFILGPFRRVTP